MIARNWTPSVGQTGSEPDTCCPRGARSKRSCCPGGWTYGSHADRIGRWGLTAFLVLCVLQVGCLRRRLTLRSDPPGALAYVDGQEIGITPVSTPFTYYGTRKVQLMKDGYETVTQLHKIKTPWYQWPGIDFLAENIYPYEIRDDRELHFAMTPQRITNVPRLVDRADELRTNLQQGIVTPLPDGEDMERLPQP